MKPNGILHRTYSDIRDAGLRSDKGMQDWLLALQRIQSRHDAEVAVIKDTRRKSPGATDSEILAKYSAYLERHFPKLSFPFEAR